jgi:hypothetical protein
MKETLKERLLGYNLVFPKLRGPGRFMVSKRSLYPLVIFLVLSGMARSGRGQSSSNTRARPAPAIPTPQIMSGPADASRCAFCHRAEVDGYSRSAMAHSLRRAGHEPEGTVEADGAKITMSSSQSGYWQSLKSGEVATKYRIDYVIGSGTHASGTCSTSRVISSSLRLRSTRVGMPMIWHPDMRDCQTRISPGPLLRAVFSATQELRCTSPAHRTDIDLQHFPRRQSPVNAVMVRLKSISAIRGRARSSILRSLNRPLATASVNSAISWASEGCSTRTRTSRIFVPGSLWKRPSPLM